MRNLQVLVVTFFLLMAVGVASAEDNSVVSWDHVIGIVLPGNVVGTGTTAIKGGGAPWVTTVGAAKVNLKSGRIAFFVRGLVLAAASPTAVIGTPGPISAVKGTLVCDLDGSASGGNSVVSSTLSVSLSKTGDAFFSGDVGSIPSVCSSETDLAFVIQASAANGNAIANGPWIANGVVPVKSHDDHGRGW